MHTPDLDRAPEKLRAAAESTPTALDILLSGQVQGVGFRPFVFQLAQSLHLHGWVRNTVGQVEIHIQGPHETVQLFMRRLFEQAPALAQFTLERCRDTEQQLLDDFRIRDSRARGSHEVHIPVDLGLCPDCQREMEDPQNRRYRYPFINCTQCGPRFTLIHSLPYDRINTTMRDFPLCEQCATEYRDPSDRRFHAEPVGCPACGPSLVFHRAGLADLRDSKDALNAAIVLLEQGGTVAVKGIGGYHLLCDAANDAAVQRLRQRKPRPDKPLAILCPSAIRQPLHCVGNLVWLSRDEADLLLSPQRPVVLARKKPDAPLSSEIAPGLNEIGVMLPYSPLHYLLANGFGKPLVATSANLSGEPVLTDNDAVVHRLAHVADAFLHHNRPIARPADDPVYRVIDNHPRLLRPGRGCAPLELELPFTLPHPVLAVGGQQKNTLALAWSNRIVISPHIGDMQHARSLEVFSRTAEDLQALYRVSASAVLCDAHPGYTTTHWAERYGLPLTRILHHHAHAATAAPAASAEQPTLVFTWDGAGYGEDGTLWGGEALLGYPGYWQRFGSLRPFHLPGGERASHEPWRSGAAVCWEAGMHCPQFPADTGLLHQAWERGLNAPRTSAAGRLFDAAAALVGICTTASYEGQAPMQLEAVSDHTAESVTLPVTQDEQGVWIINWAPLLPMLLNERIPVRTRAGRFHASLAQAIYRQARHARMQFGVTNVGLCGGVFQNRLLTGQVVERLREDGFQVAFPQQVPVNDAGLCYGQVIEYAAAQRQE